MNEPLSQPCLPKVSSTNSTRLEQLENLYKLSLDIFSAKTIDALLTDVMVHVTKAMNADRSTLFIVDPETGILWSKVAQKTEPITLPSGKGVSGWAALTGETVNIRDAYSDSRFNPEVDLRTGYQTRSILCMPVKNREGKVIAVIQAINKINGYFSADDEEFLRALSAQIQLAIENSALYQDLRDLFESTMEALASTIDARHPTTSGHTMRVRDYSLAIATEMGFETEDLEILNYAALLHDYGKIGVPEAILTKPGRLTDLEYKAMQRHVVYTIEILNKIKFSPRFKDIPYIAGQHHERVDGTGYPSGLSGPQMHPLARIMAVADVFDAMTSIRDYRDPADPDEVLEILKQAVDTHFDKDTVAAFERYFHRKNLGKSIRERNQKDLDSPGISPPGTIRVAPLPVI